MPNFTPIDADFNYMSESFHINVEQIKELQNKYKKLYESVKGQYLAHIIRSLEEYIRKELNAPFFTITCRPSSYNNALKGTGCASYIEGISFNIVYDCSLDAKSTRVIIAHELGHLFNAILFDKKYDEIKEPLSSIFGIFTIIDKNNFYANETKPLLHKSCKDIIDDFKQLENKTCGKLNIS